MTELKRLIRFALVGISGIVVNLFFLYFFVEFLGVEKVLSSFIAIEISIITNFILNDRWTFADNKNALTLPHRLVLFNFISIGGALINLGVFTILISGFSVYYIYAQLFGVAVAFGWNYLVNRRVTWK